MEFTSSQHSPEHPSAAELQADLSLVEHSTDSSFSSRRDDTKLHLDRMEKLFSEVQAQQTQVLASGRSRTTSRRSSMRRATDSDLSFAYDPQEGTGAIATVHGYAAVLSSDHIIENERQAASEGQSLGVIKVQRSLTWTEGSEMNHSQQGGGDTGQASTPTQQQPSTLNGSVTPGEGTSLQSSPSLVPPARLGAAVHRQRLASSQPEGSEESGSVSSNSSHLVPARFQAGNQEGVSWSEWYSYNPMLSVTTLGTSGSDRGSTLGGVDQSCQDFVLMASPIRGAWTVSGTPTKLPQSSMRLSHSPYAPSHPSGLPRSPFQARPMPSLSAATGNSGSPGPSGQPGSGIDAGTADSASQAGNAEEGSGFGTIALGTIQESSCSWESAPHTQPATSEAAPEAELAMMTTDGPHSPSGTHSELAESVELNLDLERQDSSSASSVRSESVSDAEINTEPTLAAHSTGHSPEKVLFSHPLQPNSSESDDAHSAAYLTSSEPSPSGQAPSNGQLCLSDGHPPLPEMPYHGNGPNPLTVKEATKSNSEEVSTPEGLWANAASPDSRVHLVGSMLQQSGGQQPHQPAGPAPVHPTPAAMHANLHLRTVTSSQGADDQQTGLQQLRAHNGTQVQESSHTMSPRSQGATPPKPPSGSPMHAYTNPAFCPAFVSRIPKPAPLHPPRKPGDPKQISAHFKRNLRSPRLPLEQSQHNFQDPKQPAAPPKSDARDPLHPLEELPKGEVDDWDEPSFGDMCRRLVAVIEGARIRRRMRQPACKGLCSEILEMDQMVLALGEAHTHTPADAGLQRQLKQHLRVRRIQLGELLASALPVPDSLPITKPLLPSHTSLSPPPSGPAAVPARGSLKGVAPAAYSTLQAAQKQLQEVKQHLSASLTLSPRASGATHTPHRMAAARAASDSPVDELTTPSPFCGSRDDRGAHTAPQGGAAKEGSSEKKPFLRRRPRHMPVSQRLNWSEVKPRTQCRLEPSYIPVRKSSHQRVSADQAASQEAARASPTATLKRPNPRKAWGSNQPGSLQSAHL
ncbi:hypothetical protein WJX79_005111 [Trebouxia sp. C0005]